MTDFNSPSHMSHYKDVLVKVVHTFAGLYFWEVVTSLDFEWSFFSGRRRFTWPMIPYFLGRYSALFTIFGHIFALNSTSTPHNCQAISIAVAIGAMISSSCATTNLAIRTMALWKPNQHIAFFLWLLVAGYWALGIPASFIHTTITGGTCVPSQAPGPLLAAAVTYFMWTNLVVFGLNAYKLFKTHTKSNLVELLIVDDLIFILIATLTNIPIAALAALGLNPILSELFVCPSSVLATIAANRVVRRLKAFDSQPPANNLIGAPLYISNSSSPAYKYTAVFTCSDPPSAFTPRQPPRVIRSSWQIRAPRSPLREMVIDPHAPLLAPRSPTSAGP